MKLIYAANTFLKETQEEIIIRVDKKELRDKNKKIKIDICREIIKKFLHPEPYVKVKELYNSFELDEVKKMLYFLIKIGALKEVDDDFVDSPINMYLLRNYEDFKEIINNKNETANRIAYINNITQLEELTFIEPFYIITTIFTENIVSHIESELKLKIICTELKRKILLPQENKKVKGILDKYCQILMLDVLSKYRKYSDTFVMTDNFEMLNYTPVSFEKNEYICDLNEMGENRFEYSTEEISKFIEFLKSHPSFFLRYEIDKSNDGYLGEYWLKGYNVEFSEISAPSFQDTLNLIADNIIKMLFIPNVALQKESTYYHKQIFELIDVKLCICSSEEVESHLESHLELYQ
ncbi:hypothetical protein [Lysinibacillus xylanilyticus]|uniref:hypothetical protein n=1 Tax=Lysinibacillus xylanilyticus TaxID=582475 RepID=UPI003827EF9D